MTSEQLAWFKYHPQTPTTAPKLEAVRAAEIACSLEVNDTMKAKCKLGEGYQRINEAMLAFAEVIDRECPKCDDKQAALMHVRHAKMAANEALGLTGNERLMFLVLSAQEMTKARWLASSAIVLHTPEAEC